MKQCTKCKECKEYKEFSKDKNRKDGLFPQCKECSNKRKRDWGKKEENKQKQSKCHKEWRNINKEHLTEYHKEWRNTNKEHLTEYRREWCSNNRDKLNKKRNQWCEENKEHLRLYRNQWYKENRERIINKNNHSKVSYTNHKNIINSLFLYENIKIDPQGHILIACTYCGYFFYPSYSQITNRKNYINGNTSKENRIYCSEKCKSNCPIYGQSLYPKGYRPATSREVQPELRQMVLKRDNYTCQRCGWHKDELDVGLHCHHIYPLNEDPIQSADIDTCITYCEDCHKWIHQNVTGCGYSEMRCS